MHHENLHAMSQDEIEHVTGGSFYAEPGQQWLVPPRVGPIGPDGQPEIIPGVELPPLC